MSWVWALQWLALVHTWLWWLRWTMLAEFVKHLWNDLLTVSLQSKQIRLGTPLNQAAAMLKLSGQSDPDPQSYLRNTQTDRQTDGQRFLAFIERYVLSSTGGDLFLIYISDSSDLFGLNITRRRHISQCMYLLQKICVCNLQPLSCSESISALNQPSASICMCLRECILLYTSVYLRLWLLIYPSVCMCRRHHVLNPNSFNTAVSQWP